MCDSAVMDTLTGRVGQRRPRSAPISDELAETWRRYRENNDDLEARNALIEHYYDFVAKVAGGVVKTMPALVDRHDLTSYGIFGLIDAMRSFDPAKNDRFEGYAVQRVRGSIYDELRKIDRVPRNVRSRARDVEIAIDVLVGNLGRYPSDDEVAAYLGLSLSDYWTLIAFDTQAPADLSDGELAAYSVPDVSAEPESMLEVGELSAILGRAIACMPVRDRTLLALTYIEEMTLEEVGKVFGVTESRICQLQGQILRQLRTHLGADA